jgi:hypothetical protein
LTTSKALAALRGPLGHFLDPNDPAADPLLAVKDTNNQVHDLPSTVGLRRVSAFGPDRQKHDSSGKTAYSAKRCPSVATREEDAGHYINAKATEE